MNITRSRILFLISGLLIVLFAGCSVNQNIRMTDEFGAEGPMEIELSDELLAYLLDLSGVLGEQEQDVSPFDLEQLAVLMDEEPGLELLDAEIPAQQRLTMRVAAEDIERVFTEGPHRVEGLVTAERQGREHTVTIELDRTRMQQITSLSPVAEESAVEFLLPPERMDTDEYVEYLAWAMEEYEQETPIEEVIRDAVVELRVEVPGTLLSVDGGEADGNTAVFAEGAARLLTVRETTRWSVTWRR
ncbi:MAG: hypothetical protein ACOC0B_01120 [bacterium]